MEIKKSSERRQNLLGSIANAIMRWQDETQAYDEAIGEIMDLNVAERRCLGVLHHGPRSAGEISAVTGLTPAAVTALIDRLEARGFLTRARSLEDRRKVIIEATAMLGDMAERYYQPIARDGAKLLDGFSDLELGTILEFLTAAGDLQRDHLSRLANRDAKRR